MYLFLAPTTARQENKDWSHLWLGGRMIATGHADRMYDPQLQVEVYRQAHPSHAPPAVWRERNEILGCFNYPPPAALAYAPLSWMPMGTAAIVNAYLTIALIFVIAWMLIRPERLAAHDKRENRGSETPFLAARPTGETPVPQFRHWLLASAWPLVVVAFLAYPPFFINLSIGQNAVVTTFVLTVVYCLCRSGRDFAAGLALGLLICKPNWLLALGWIPLIHGRWRMLAGTAVSAAAVVAGTVLVLGIKPFLDYASLFQNVSHLNELPDYALNLKYSGLGMFRKWLGADSIAANVAGYVSCAIVILVTWRATRGLWRPGTDGFRRLAACGLVAALWINPHLNYYDLVPIALVIIAVAPDIRTLRPWHRNSIFACGVVLLTYAAVPWDRLWGWGSILPVPTIAILALWAWFVHGNKKSSSTNHAGA